MKPGRTANIRINPRDCMSCIDVIKKTGVNLEGASFPVIVSAVLSSLLESLRQSRTIPTRGGFEYGEIMKSYPMQTKAGRARALSITRTIELGGSDIQVPPVVRSPDMERKKVRFDSLAFRDENDSINMSEEERQEMLELARELNPL